jgi:imidazoleglycerol-phosphate dehydratase
MKASSKRVTGETDIEISVESEGKGKNKLETGIQLLDMILDAFSRGSGYDLTVIARGDLETGDHHTTEDVGITLGCVLAQIIKTGIGSSFVPKGQTLALVAVRFGEPGYCSELEFRASKLCGMSLENFDHFLRSLAYSGHFTMHVNAKGGDDKSKIEAVSMALGMALKEAALDIPAKKMTKGSSTCV